MDHKNPVETAKVLGSLYGSLVILFSVLFFFSAPYFATFPTDVAMRSFWLVWIIGCTIVLIGAEIVWQLRKSGMTLISFFGFLFLNLFLIVMALAVFADIVTPTTLNLPIQLVILLVVASLFGYVILIFWTLKDWRIKKN